VKHLGGETDWVRREKEKRQKTETEEERKMRGDG
jgi:hypothetical protein